MVDRPMASTSSAGRPRMRSRSVHLPSCIPMAPKEVRPRTKSVQKTQVKGKGKGKSTKEKSSKNSCSSKLRLRRFRVDFLLHPPNQPHDIPTEQPQEPNPPADVPAKETQEPDHPLDAPVEGLGEPERPQQPVDIPAGEPEPVPMANNQLNWSHF